MERLTVMAATAALLVLSVLQEAEAMKHAATQWRGGRRLAKKMVFYMHDVPAPPSPTAVVVAGQNGSASTGLGETLVFDDKLTAGPDPSSLQVGRGQGLYSLASLPGSPPALLLVFTAVFHRPTFFNGSTLCLHGSDAIFMAEREVAVVGGTGRFRLARGYATLSTTSINLNNLNAIIKFNVTVFL